MFKRNSNNIEESESLSDVKDLVKDLSDKISLKEGKDEERYEMVNRLTSAFTGGTKKQGAAGEILLINILQQSGLREGKDFEVQKKFDDEVNGEPKENIQILFYIYQTAHNKFSKSHSVLGKNIAILKIN